MTAYLMCMTAWKDWKEKRIPDRYILGIFISGIISMYLIPEILLIQRVGGLFSVSTLLFVLTCLVPGSIGGGDIKLMAAGGFLLGSLGVWNAFVTGIMSAGSYVLIMLIMKRMNRKTEIALGPFLCAGMMIQLLKI